MALEIPIAEISLVICFIFASIFGLSAFVNRRTDESKKHVKGGIFLVILFTAVPIFIYLIVREIIVFV